MSDINVKTTEHQLGLLLYEVSGKKCPNIYNRIYDFVDVFEYCKDCAYKGLVIDDEEYANFKWRDTIAMCWVNYANKKLK